MGRRIGPSLTTHTITGIASFWRAIPCPKCHAPRGAPCADFRTYDKDLYGVRVHRERRQAVANEVAR